MGVAVVDARASGGRGRRRGVVPDGRRSPPAAAGRASPRGRREPPAPARVCPLARPGSAARPAPGGRHGWGPSAAPMAVQQDDDGAGPAEQTGPLEPAADVEQALVVVQPPADGVDRAVAGRPDARRGRRPRRDAGGDRSRWRAGRESAPACRPTRPARRGRCRHAVRAAGEEGDVVDVERSGAVMAAVPSGGSRAVDGPTGRGSAKGPDAPAVRVRGWPPPVRPGSTPRPRRWPASPPRPPTGRRLAAAARALRRLPRAGRGPAARRRRRRPASGRPRFALVGEAPGRDRGRDRPAVRRAVRRAARPAARRGRAGPRRRPPSSTS